MCFVVGLLILLALLYFVKIGLFRKMKIKHKHVDQMDVIYKHFVGTVGGNLHQRIETIKHHVSQIPLVDRAYQSAGE